MLIDWFLSRTVRQAAELRRQVFRLVNEQRDILQAQPIDAILKSVRNLDAAIAARSSDDALQAHMTDLTEVANQQLKPFPNAATRENVKELFVAATVILAFTTFFLQLTKIPTGSMQPTLFGITSQDLRQKPDFQMPSRLSRIFQYWWRGVSYYEVIAKADGQIEEIDPPQFIFPFVKKQRIRIAGQWETVWFPPENFSDRARIQVGQTVHAGEAVVRMRVAVGDHLLVDRFTYNFKRPRRGEIFVFKTRGIPDLVQDQLYIKRLVALSGEKVRIGNDQHLIINGQRLDATTPGFENVYTFSPKWSENHYFGHVNQLVASRWRNTYLAPLFPDQDAVHEVGPRHYFAMGDNTMNSRDSRDWGDVPRENVIGRCWFVYWPFTDRFGWSTQ